MNPERRAILESVKRVRDGVDAHKHAPFARHTMRIPMADYQALILLYPDLNNFDDPQAQRVAWDAFELSPISERYRVGRLHRGVIKDGVISE
jgi:hypothetical protein